MILKINFFWVIGWVASLLPAFGASHVSPRLELYNNSVRAIDLDKSLVAALRGAPEEVWSAEFPVYTKSAYAKGLSQPIAGRYTFDHDALVFTPLFTFSEGETYFAVLEYATVFKKLQVPLPVRFADQEKTIRFTFSIPKSNAPSPFIVAVYPMTDTLPENVLRMYIYFSAPMSTGEAYSRIHLVDEQGHPVEKAFLEIDQELWDSQRQRFTLLFDPGRIKRGLKSNLDLGAPLKSNHSFRLIIDSSWRDERGNPLATTYEKKFIVKDSEREKLTTRNWKVVSPKAGSKNPLVVQFDKPMDYALVLKYVSVTNSMTVPLPGHSNLTKGERAWIFNPGRKWEAGTYTIEISPQLEDVCGNNFNNPFDLDLSVSARENSDLPIRLVFTVGEVY